MNLENHRVNNLCLKSLYLGFILFLCFSIWTVIIMNIQWNLKEYPHNLTKYETNQTSNISISQLFIKLGKNWKCSIDLYSIFQILHELVRFRNPDTKRSKTPKYLCELGKTQKYSLRLSLKKSQFWIDVWIGKSYVLI